MMKKTVSTLVFAIVALAAWVGPDISAAHANRIPVLVMIDDSVQFTVPRHNRMVHESVLSGVQGQLARQGFRIITERMAAAELGWRPTTQRPKEELFSVLQMMRTADDVRLQPRVGVLYRLNARLQKTSFASKLTIWVSGEMYDAASRSFLDEFESERRDYNAPFNCNNVCIADEVSDHARDIANHMANVLARKLEIHAGVPQGAPGDGAPAGMGLETSYNLEFRNFENGEFFRMVGVMENEFPGFVGKNIAENTEPMRRVLYTSRAQPDKILEWMHILIDDMGISRYVDVQTYDGGTRLVLDKIAATPRANTGGSRFN